MVQTPVRTGHPGSGSGDGTGLARVQGPVYLPGVGHAIGALVSYNLATLGLILILPDVHRGFVIVPLTGLAGLAIPWFRAVIIRDYTLPAPGQSDRLFFFPPR